MSRVSLPGWIDPRRFGADGSGGEPSLEALALLSNGNVAIAETGVDDLRAGRIDPRIVAVLTRLSADHQITVSSMCADHSKFTAGGSISTHHYGRGVDIAAIDGVPVDASNSDARAIAMELQELDCRHPARRDRHAVGDRRPRLLHRLGNQHHLHIGFKQQITPGSSAPGGPAAEGAATATRFAIAAVAPPSEPPAGDPAPVLCGRGGEAALAFRTGRRRRIEGARRR